jgi:murein lipoprotein
MRNFMLAVTAVSLLALGGCASQTTTTAPKAAEAAKPTISAEAQSALSAAQAAVKDAKAKGALWTTAENALKAAEAAAEKGDSEGVIKNAKTASDHVKMGLEQAKYPVLQIKDL